MYAVEMENVIKRFGNVTALANASFVVERGEALGLVGPSGCGKTTVLRVIAGLDTPDSGMVRINGMDAAGISPADRRVGMVFQNLALWPHMNAEQHIEFVLGPVVSGRSARRGRADELLDMCRIGHKRAAYPHEMSGGERQRLAIARALAGNPELLLLDEPLTGLDTELRKTVTREILELRNVLDATLIFVSHRRHDIKSVADRTLFMRDGKTIGPLAVETGTDRRDDPEIMVL